MEHTAVARLPCSPHTSTRYSFSASSVKVFLLSGSIKSVAPSMLPGTAALFSPTLSRTVHVSKTPSAALKSQTVLLVSSSLTRSRVSEIGYSPSDLTSISSSPASPRTTKGGLKQALANMERRSHQRTVGLIKPLPALAWRSMSGRSRLVCLDNLRVEHNVNRRNLLKNLEDNWR